MCTVSWIHEGDRYQLLCNRDEQRSRAAAHHPRIAYRDGVQFIAPYDPVGGGTWIAANEFGVTLCLLNANGARKPNSRGQIIPQLISARNANTLRGRVAALDLDSTSPFTLVFTSPCSEPASADWNGTDLLFPVRAPMPLTSSSFDVEGVAKARVEEFDRCRREADRLNGAVLSSFHASHVTGKTAYSPCMHRPDAETVSFSWLRVDSTAVQFLYAPAAPCRRGPSKSYLLPRSCNNFS